MKESFYPFFMDLLHALSWRYAVKQFDAEKKIPAETADTLLKSLVLTPSSYGLQPWKFLVIENPAIREKLKAVSWNQPQITDASHLVVLCRRTDVDESFIQHYISEIASQRGVSEDELAGYLGMMVQNVVQGKNNTNRAEWAKDQVYIALGNLLTSAAILEVDTCPIEGFSAPDYDAILGLSEKNLASCVVCALGYRSANDEYAQHKKVRFNASEVVEVI